MKIAYVLNTYPRPSHSFIRREIHALEAQGHEVVRIAMRQDAAPLVDAGDQAEAGRVTRVLAQGPLRLLGAFCAEGMRHPKGALRALAEVWRLGRAGGRGVSGTGGVMRHLIYLAEAAFVARQARAVGAGHLHAHFGTNSAAIAMLAHLLGGLPYSFTVHGPEEFDAPRALSLGRKAGAAAFVVAISSFGRSQLMRWVDPADWGKLRVVHCGIETARFREVPPMPEGAGRLVTIGRLSEQKGQLLLIEALARAVVQAPNLHLTIVGDGELRAPIKAAIARLGLAGHVRMAGWLDEAGVRAELAQAHAMVLPSFAEGLPMVVMEAMAAARPVIATAIAGVPELVLPAQTGWLVPAGDVEALAQAMIDWANGSPADHTRMGLAGRQRVLTRHDVDKEAASLGALFEAGPRAVD